MTHKHIPIFLERTKLRTNYCQKERSTQQDTHSYTHTLTHTHQLKIKR